MTFQHFTSLNNYFGHIISIQSMDMRWVMLRLLEIHTNNNSMNYPG